VCASAHFVLGGHLGFGSTSPLPVKHPIAIQDGNIKEPGLSSVPFQSNACTAGYGLCFNSMSTVTEIGMAFLAV